MGACESCGGRDRTEVTIEPKPKRDGSDEISTTSRGAPGSTSAGSRSQASPRGGGGGSGPFSPRSGDGDKPAKLLRPQSSEAVRVDGSAQRQASSSVSQKRPAPQATKTKLTPLGEGDEPPSLDRALSPRAASPSTSAFAFTSTSAAASTSASSAADRYKASPKADDGPSRVLKPKAASQNSLSAEPKRDEVKRSESAGIGGGKKKEREMTSGSVALSSSPSGSAANPMSGSLKRVQTPATGAVATPLSPLRTPIGGGSIAEGDESGATKRAPSMAAALAAAAPAPSFSAALAAAAPASPSPAPAPAAPHEPVKPKPLDTSVSALLPSGSAPPTPSRAGTAITITTPITTPKAAATPEPDAEPPSPRDTRDAEAKAEAARQRQQTLKDERLARERADTAAAAKAAAEAAEAESARAARAEAAKKERDAKFAAIAEEKKRAAEAEAAQKKAEDEKKARIAENPSAVSMADKAALIAGALTPKAGDAANIETLVREQLSPAPAPEVNLNNCKVFGRVVPEKLNAAYKTLIDALCAPHNAHVTSLSMTYCGLTDDFLVLFAAALPQLPAGLTEVVLESNSLGGNGLKALAAALPANHTIRTFKFDNQKGGVFPPEARRAVIAALEVNDTVTSFGLAASGSVEERNAMDKHIQKNRARLRAASTPKAAKVAVDNPFTQRMEAVRSNADPNFSFELKDATHRQQFMGWASEQQSKWLTDVAATNTHVSELKLNGLQLKEAVLTALCSALAGNKHIAKLDLSSNAMTEPCVRALTDCLRANATIAEVRLTECKMSVKCEALFMALAESGANKTLRALKMSWADKNAEKKVEHWLQHNKKTARDASKYATL